MNRLVIFTAIYPYGTGIEVFLEEEIKYLCHYFDEVDIFPFSGDTKTKRETPSNCQVHPPFIQNKFRQYVKALFPGRSFALFFRDFIGHKVFLNKTKLHIWLITYIHTNCILRSFHFKEVLQKVNQEDVFYFYWGKNANAISPFIKGKVKLVSRFHGEWDLWEESSGNYAAIREKIAKSLNLAAFISNAGQEYFKQRYPYCSAEVHRLGSLDNGNGRKSDDGVLRIVSCSSVYPLKRVPLIFDVVRNLKRKKVEWTHIGGGLDFDELKNYVASNEQSNLKVNLFGQQSHDFIYNYYRSCPIDLFINLSTNEGVPVSIMEAISFNIPIVATNVGVTSEIVNEETGILVSAYPTIKEVCTAVETVLNRNLEPRVFWDANYNAEVNYIKFAERIRHL